MSYKIESGYWAKWARPLPCDDCGAISPRTVHSYWVRLPDELKVVCRQCAAGRVDMDSAYFDEGDGLWG